MFEGEGGSCLFRHFKAICTDIDTLVTSNIMVQCFATIQSNLQHECQAQATQVQHDQHECDTSAALATRLRHKCDTSATQTTRERHECNTSGKF